MVEGQNQTGRNAVATEFEGGTVHLLETTIGDNATSTELTNNSEASATTQATDWTISHDNTAGTTTLENSAVIDFGSISGFTVNQVVVESPNNADRLLLDDSPTGDTGLSGTGDTTIEANELTFTLGGE
jgi:hypothetical protein